MLQIQPISEVAMATPQPFESTQSWPEMNPTCAAKHPVDLGLW